MIVKEAAFSKSSKDGFTIRFKNGVTATLIVPQEKEETSLIEQIQRLFCFSTGWLRVFATYSDGNKTEDITEQLTGMKGDYAVASAEELADFLYFAKNYIKNKQDSPYEHSIKTKTNMPRL